jgi:hypothetical protein
VAVLFIKWAEEQEEVKTTDQVEKLDALFRERFQYDTTIVELDTSRDIPPSPQLFEHLSSFVRTYDGSDNLLIVYYSGFGVLRGGHDKFLELSPMSKPLEKDVLASWITPEVALHHGSVKSDVWTILTTPFAPKVYSRRKFRKQEFLSECPERTSKFSEPRSFNRSVIRSLNILLDEMPNIPFTTEHLHRLILIDPTRRHMRVELRRCLDFQDEEPIVLVPIPDRDITFNRKTSGALDMTKSWNYIFQKNSLLLPAALADDNWGDDFDASSNTSHDQMRNRTRDDFSSLATELADFLWYDWCLYHLYRKLPGKMGRRQFVKHHDKILMKFFEGLQLEVGETHMKSIRHLEDCVQRTLISERIYNLSYSPPDLSGQHGWWTILAMRERKGYKEDYEDMRPLTKGLAFLTLWNDLYSVLTPYLSVENALTSGNIHILRSLVTQDFHNALTHGNIDYLRRIVAEYFDMVAVGEYSWIKELADAGYTPNEIADLLYEEAFDGPHIFFEPEALNQDPVLPDPEMHIPSCVHHILSDPHQYRPLHSILKLEDNHIVHQVQELCGLAGVTPTSGPKEKWIKSVDFRRQGTVATVRYTAETKSDVFHQITTTLERLCSAVARFQSYGYCCNSFTALIQNQSFYDDHPQIKVYRIQLRDVITLLEELRDSNLATLRQQPRPLETALHILGPLHSREGSRPGLQNSLGLLSVAAQFLSMSFLSYTQGHVGPIKPFFLDTALSGIYLSGMGSGSPLQLKATYAELTCVGEMLTAPVLTFSARQENGFRKDITGQKFDLLTTAEDFLDMWGPGNFILPKVDEQLPCAIRIAGGTICGYGSSNVKFHWAKNISLDGTKPVSFDPRKEIIIGGLISVNSRCQINERESWNKSCSAFEYLGVYGESWVYDEKQNGGQAGQYIMLQHNRIKHKVPGKTLKQFYLDQGPETLVCILNCLWGLQVSFCTGVTRRVPLRLLIADLLPYFARLFSNCRDVWKELQDKHDILNAFHTEDIQDRLEKLPHELNDLVMQLVTRILSTLQPTGIDQEGKFLLVAWPYDCPPFRCFKIPCDDKLSSWARILADSEDCATFAYISTSCFETAAIKCRGPSPLWHNKTPLLETAVVRHNETPSTPLGPLEHKKAYFFKKLNSLMQATVIKQAGTQVSLVVSTSAIPERFLQRVYAMEMKKNRRPRIRERQKQDEIGAENVAILTKSESAD